MKIRNLQDFWCGMTFVALGALAVFMARDYEMGEALAMGPGYFPTWLGVILIGFGLAIGASALRFDDTAGERRALRDWAFRPWLVLPATLAVYAWLMDAGAGFVPSLMVLIIGCALAHKDVHWGETLLLSIFVTAGAVGIFYYGIELPYRLFPWSD